VEQGGWLDQLILGTLQFVTQSWVELVVGLGGGFALAVLARLSPRRDWEEVTGLPGRALLGAVWLLAFLKTVPRLVVPKTTLSCDDVAGPFGIPQKSCHFTTTGTFHTVQDFTVLDAITEIVESVARDALLALAGWGLGWVVMTVLLRMRRRPGLSG